MSRVLAIGDIHEPFVHPRYLKFTKEIYKKHKCNKVVFMGDMVDNHAISYHESDPDGYSAGIELKKAREGLKKWWKAYPTAKVCLGNHDKLPQRQIKTAGIPADMLKDHNEIWHTPDTWEWDTRFEIDGVQYIHGIGFSGQNAALKACKDHRISTVIGHVHTFAGIQYSASNKDLLFGMNVGWGGDITSYSQEYGKEFANRPVVACGVVEDGYRPYITQ